jgi:hypothetical protein
MIVGPDRLNDLIQRQVRLLDDEHQQKFRMVHKGRNAATTLGFAATLPVCSQRWAQSTTTLGLSSYRSAASRRDAPASIASIIAHASR